MAAKRGADKLVAELRQWKDPRELHALAQALGTLVARATDAKAAEVWQRARPYISSPSSLDCEVLAGFLRKGQTPLVLDLMKWPTCFSTESLIRRIEELENVSFKNERQKIVLLKFYEWLKPWAEKNNYDLSAPPQPQRGMPTL